MSPQLDLEEVRAALAADVRGVLDAYGWSYRREGAQLISKACPARADHSRPCWKVSAVTGLWRCLSCGTAGDLLAFIAAAERLHPRRDFPAVVARGAAIAGVDPTVADPAERAARRAAAVRAREEREARERAERVAREAAAIPKATAYWTACAPEHPAGAAYLAARGIAAAARLCRFDPRLGGSPAIPLYTSRGEIRNVVRRALPEVLAAMPDDRRDGKTPGLAACPTAGTLLGTIGAIRPGQRAVVVEGVADALTAAIAWPRAVVLGAHGADNLPAVVQVAARRCAAVGARLALVPHNDAPGLRRAAEAVALAAEAGLGLAAGTLAIVNHPEKDLNDAWRAGWRPAA